MTPLVKQYTEIKKKHSDCLLLFQLGDFYELFYEDAKKASAILSLTLTQRQGIPMCGVPIRAAHRYIEKLVHAGQSVAICDQVTAPNKANKLVERKITEILTPGAITNGAFLDPSSYNFLALLAKTASSYTAVWADVSTTKLYLQRFSPQYSAQDVGIELRKINPNELILDAQLYGDLQTLGSEGIVHKADDWLFEKTHAYAEICEHFQVKTMKGFGIAEKDECVPVLAAFFRFLKRLELGSCVHVQHLVVLDTQSRLRVDKKTLEQLQVFSDKGSVSLFGLLNKCSTAMGMRYLRESLMQPLIQKEGIEHRHKGIARFISDAELRSRCTRHLKNIADIPRILARLSVGKGNYTHIHNIYSSLLHAEQIDSFIEESFYENSSPISIEAIQTVIQVCEDALEKDTASEYHVRVGFDERLDEQYTLQREGRNVAQSYIDSITQKYGLEQMKLGFNRLLGYYIEIRNAKNTKIPTEFILRQQLKGVFRYKTHELQSLEDKILAAGEQIRILEQEILDALIAQVLRYKREISLLADRVAYADFIVSLAIIAEKNEYCCPRMVDENVLTIRKGRHPLVEQSIQDALFVPNDLEMSDTAYLHIITGPNMAGKSTYLRQNALILLMAHIGAYLPAESASIPVCDALFCRMGAADNIVQGESTFLLEMLETAYILRHASMNSFVVFDEIGRGTSSLDGFSIAWAVVEYMVSLCKARCLFATHFHDFAELEHPAVRFYTLRTRRADKTVYFFRKLTEGIIPHSFGIEVARMAGIKENILRIAQDKLDQLLHDKTEALSDSEAGNGLQESDAVRPSTVYADLYEETSTAAQGQRLLEALDRLDPENMTPIEALQCLIALKAEQDIRS